MGSIPVRVTKVRTVGRAVRITNGFCHINTSSLSLSMKFEPLYIMLISITGNLSTIVVDIENKDFINNAVNSDNFINNMKTKCGKFTSVFKSIVIF